MSLEFNRLMTGDEANALAVAELSEFVEDRLFLMVLSNHREPATLKTFSDWKTSLADDDVFYLNVDDSLVYDGFFSDFGPLNLAMIYRYVDIVRNKFKMYKRIVHCSHKSDQRKRTNAAFLISAYMVIENGWTAHQVYSMLSQKYKYNYIPFRDASCLLNSEYSVTIEECINALYKAKWYRFFDFNDFDVEEYEKYETVEFGDINWIVPDTLLAFSSPHSRDYTDKAGYLVHSPSFYYEYFKKNNVKHVVRLNNKRTYDAKRTFVEVANIQHSDMVFTDGTPPTDAILRGFLNLCERYIGDVAEVRRGANGEMTEPVDTRGAVAVHCKAGLGRTGCLVASYIVKHWSFTAAEAIAWIRICRPGSVIGVQQQWLVDKEVHLKTAGKQWRDRRKHAVGKYKRFANGVYSVRRHDFDVNACEHVDPPPESCLSGERQSVGGKTTERVTPEPCHRSTLSSTLKRKSKANNNAGPVAARKDVVPSARQKRSASKTDDPRLGSSAPSTVKSSRRIANASDASCISDVAKKKITVTNTITIGNSGFMGSAASGQNTTRPSSDKTRGGARKTVKRHTGTATKVTATESKPSYALSTVSSSARASRRLLNKN